MTPKSRAERSTAYIGRMPFRSMPPSVACLKINSSVTGPMMAIEAMPRMESFSCMKVASMASGSVMRSENILVAKMPVAAPTMAYAVEAETADEGLKAVLKLMCFVSVRRESAMTSPTTSVTDMADDVAEESVSSTSRSIRPASTPETICEAMKIAVGTSVRRLFLFIGLISFFYCSMIM